MSSFRWKEGTKEINPNEKKKIRDPEPIKIEAKDKLNDNNNEVKDKGENFFNSLKVDRNASSQKDAKNKLDKPNNSSSEGDPYKEEKQRDLPKELKQEELEKKNKNGKDDLER